MFGGGRRGIPSWAGRQRTSDLAWIMENWHIFWPAAQAQVAEKGRGAVVVDTTQQPVAGEGHPFAYYTEEQLKQIGESDALRMVAQYDSKNELVVVMLKHRGRVSTYRIQRADTPPPATVEQN